MNDNEIHEKAYWTNEIATILDIADSTLRKWCIELEKNGYQFVKGKNESRAFTDHDLIALKHFQDLIKNKKLSKENAAIIVVERFTKNDVTIPVPLQDHKEQERSIAVQIQQLQERLEKQDQFNKSLIEKIDRQQEFINQRLKERDEHLMKTLREIQNTQKLIAAANDKKWWKFWKKKRDISKNVTNIHST